MYLCGQADHSIDEKNRLAIPAKFRSQLDPQRDGPAVIVVPGIQPRTLCIYSQRQFENLVSQGESSLIPGEEQREFDEIFFPLAERVEPDSQGRILIPEQLLSLTEISREVVICGMRDHLEVRPRGEFREQLQEKYRRFREFQSKARNTYKQGLRQTGPEAGRS